jgi:XTP/dITP diphosphohydrolase
VYSARYAGYGCTFQDNNRKLLRALRNTPLSKRSALFRCVVAFAAPDGRTRLFEGRCPGRIVTEIRGKNGFGYDPVFRPSGAGKTFAELSLAEKNRLSHRAKAFKKAAAWLRTSSRGPKGRGDPFF